MIEKTLVILKPDCVCRKNVGKVIDRFEHEGLQLQGLRMIHMTRKEAEGFYQVPCPAPLF